MFRSRPDRELLGEAVDRADRSPLQVEALPDADLGIVDALDAEADRDEVVLVELDRLGGRA